MALSKSEILFSYPQGESEPYGHVPTNRIYEAMDLFAKQVAIAFAEWVQESFDGFSYSTDTKNWEVYGKTRSDTKQLTTEQLYELFLSPQ